MSDERLAILERFGSGDIQDLVAAIRELRADLQSATGSYRQAIDALSAVEDELTCICPYYTGDDERRSRALAIIRSLVP